MATITNQHQSETQLSLQPNTHGINSDILLAIFDILLCLKLTSFGAFVNNEIRRKALFESQLWPGCCNTLPGEAAVSLIDTLVPQSQSLALGGFGYFVLVKLSPMLTKKLKNILETLHLHHIIMQFLVCFLVVDSMSRI